MERDRHRQLTDFQKKSLKEQKEMNMVRNLKKEVTTGANGTQDYIIKKGINSGKIADKGQ
mgnify:FL=1|jgi:hypothetical protein|tara:strand:+ start:240 stop:419 length:180 start_codon:yes stop_codon:yes gene_type:complete